MADAQTIAIVSLGLAQLAVIVRVAIWAGEKNEEIKGKASGFELEKLRTELATAKGVNAEAAAAAAKTAVASTIGGAVAEEVRRLSETFRRDLRRELDEIRSAKHREHDEMNRKIERLDYARDSLTRLTERAERLEELVSRVDALDGCLDTLKDAMGAWSRAGARLEWRIEAVEEAIRKKLGSHPRMFAIREPPPALGPSPFDAGATNPGIGPSPPRRAPSAGGTAATRPAKRPLPREDPPTPPPRAPRGRDDGGGGDPPSSG